MDLFERLCDVDAQESFTASETPIQEERPRKKVRVIPLSESDFEYLEWRRARMARRR